MDHIREGKEASEAIIQALEQASHHEDPGTAERAQQILQILAQKKSEAELSGSPQSSVPPLVLPINFDIEKESNITSPSPPVTLTPPAPQPRLFPPPAGVFRRAVALFIDMIILAVICIAIGLLLGSLLEYMGPYTRLISAAIALFYFGVRNSISFSGSTIGKRAMHLRVIGPDGGYISLRRSFLRSSILTFFFLFSGWLLPISATNIITQFLQLFIVLGLIGAVVYLILFNRKTGQNLDDLLAGTRVVYDKGVGVEAYPSTLRKHIYAALSTFILLPFLAWGISQALNKSPALSTLLEKIMPLYNALSQNERFFQVGVNDRTQYLSGQPAVRVLTVTLYPRNYLTDADRQLIAQNVAEIAQNYVTLSDYNGFLVQIVSGYDLGFFDRSTIWYCIPPYQCSQKVVTSRILRLFSFTVSYVRGN